MPLTDEQVQKLEEKKFMFIHMFSAQIYMMALADRIPKEILDELLNEVE